MRLSFAAAVVCHIASISHLWTKDQLTKTIGSNYDEVTQGYR